jgi:hypothetical protein
MRYLRIIPVTRTTAALWAWRNRRELGRWAGFALRALTPTGESREDVLTEARLRAALARDERTRGLPTLAVRVSGATAILDGRMSSPLHDLVYSIAESIRGVASIECRIQDRRALGPARPHVHAVGGSVPQRADLPPAP